MALPSPPGPSTPPAAQQWAEDVTDTIYAHDGRLDVVEQVAADALPKAGGTTTGPILLHTSEPATDAEAASKKYVDDSVSGGATEAGTVATSESTTSTSYTDLTTPGPAATIEVPASGRVLVTLTMQIQHSNSAGGGASFALSGANTAAASDAKSVTRGGATGAGLLTCAGTWLVTGLDPGSTTFTAKYKSANGGNMTFVNRNLIVQARP